MELGHLQSHSLYPLAPPASTQGRKYGSAYFSGSATNNNNLFITGSGATTMTLVTGNNTLTGSGVAASNEIEGCISYKVANWGPVTLPPVAGLVGVNDLNASVKKFFGVGSSDCSTIGNCPTLTNVGGATLGYLGSGLYTVTVPNGTCAQVLSCKFIANSSTTSLGMTQDSTAPTSTVYRANLRVTTSGVASTGRVDYECSCVAN